MGQRPGSENPYVSPFNRCLDQLAMAKINQRQSESTPDEFTSNLGSVYHIWCRLWETNKKPCKLTQRSTRENR